MKNSIFLAFCLLFVNAWALSYDEVKNEFQKAQVGCNQNNGEACFSLGNLYESPLYYKTSQGTFAKFAQPNCSNAIKSYEKSCSLNYDMGCVSLGFIYGRGGCSESPKIMQQDLSRAKAYFKLACDLKPYERSQRSPGCGHYDALDLLGIR